MGRKSSQPEAPRPSFQHLLMICMILSRNPLDRSLSSVSALSLPAPSHLLSDFVLNTPKHIRMSEKRSHPECLQSSVGWGKRGLE